MHRLTGYSYRYVGCECWLHPEVTEYIGYVPWSQNSSSLFVQKICIGVRIGVQKKCRIKLMSDTFQIVDTVCALFRTCFLFSSALQNCDTSQSCAPLSDWNLWIRDMISSAESTRKRKLWICPGRFAASALSCHFPLFLFAVKPLEGRTSERLHDGGPIQEPAARRSGLQSKNAS